MFYHGGQKSFEEIYKEVLESLTDRAKEFAAKNPYHAYFLGVPSTDPDVERLIEGNAYIAAKIVQLLDSQLPELTHTLVDLFFPQFLKPFPPCTMIEFQPSNLAEAYSVPRGYQVSSVPVEGTPCEFRTTFNLDVLPLKLESANLVGTRLELRFEVVHGAKLASLNLTKLRLYLQRTTLCYWLCRHTDKISVTHLNGTKIEPNEQIELTLSQVGFDDTESLLPHSKKPSAAGYRFFIEYFAFPEKFKFVELVGLEAVADLAGQYPSEEGEPDSFTITFNFSRRPNLTNLRISDIRLNCTPAVNLFDEIEIVDIDYRKSEYLIRKPNYNEIYSFDSVEPVFGNIPKYEPLYSLKYNGVLDDVICYQIHFRNSISDDEDIETYISFVQPGIFHTMPQANRIAVHMTCTNRRLAERLSAGHITSKEGDLKSFRNIMGVTPSLRLPLDASLHWRLIKHLAQNRSSITGRESLQQVLSLCDFHREGQEARVNQRRLDGLQSVKARNAVRLDFGFPIYGTQVEVGLRRDYFEDEGDIFIFASVLEHFFEDYAPINSFVQLIAKDDGGEELLCPRPLRRGKKPQL